MKQYFIEQTDTFSGEANYSWVNRYLVSANTARGAMWKVSRETGYPARLVMDSGDMRRYDVPGCAICYFVTEAEGTEADKYNRLILL